MADLTRKRRVARELRRKRRDLVHAAGCTMELCCVRSEIFGSPCIVTEAHALGIRIPRSLRRHWGIDG